MDTLQSLVAPLVEWYLVTRRDLPWRHTRDPYKIWLSEIMLQQTRVETVKDYYVRFLAELPSIADLAACDERKLLKLWEGLGYYTRAKNLKRAAETIVSRYGGVFPNDVASIRSLPGIGDYTAGAIASIAFGIPEPAVDGNVLRVVSRVTGSEANIDRPETKKEFAARLRAVYPAGRESEFTQALMELGALRCLPNGAPDCGACPLRDMCAAYQDGTWTEIPVRAEKKARRAEELTVLVLVCRDLVALSKRGQKGLLSGLWEFPNLSGKRSEEEVAKELSELGLDAKILCSKPTKHIFTHVEWHMTAYLIKADRPSPAFSWVTREELRTEIPLPTAFRGCAELLDRTGGSE